LCDTTKEVAARPLRLKLAGLPINVTGNWQTPCPRAWYAAARRRLDCFCGPDLL